MVLASFGDPLGFWYGRWMTFAVRHLAKMVPAFRLFYEGRRAASGLSPQALTEGHGKPPRRATVVMTGIAFLQCLGGTHRPVHGIAVLTHGNVIAATCGPSPVHPGGCDRISDIRKANLHCRAAAKPYSRSARCRC